jgi:diaminopimelate epimerase
MVVHFSKYHGTGNDFIMIDGRECDLSLFNTDLIKQLCDRRFGVGGDGLIILEQSRQFDFSMRYFNADGKEGTMCGNGGRCITSFANRLGIVHSETIFEGIDGTHTASLVPNGDVHLKMADVSGIEKFEDGYLLNTGSPHFVIFVADPEKIDVEHDGAEIRHQKRFGDDGVNVNFVKTDPGSGHIAVRTFERGVERETWSCGTGVTAAAIVSAMLSGTEISSTRVNTRGGVLNVAFKAAGSLHFTEIYLTGPASHVYDGTIEIVV